MAHRAADAREAGLVDPLVNLAQDREVPQHDIPAALRRRLAEHPDAPAHQDRVPGSRSGQGDAVCQNVAVHPVHARIDPDRAAGSLAGGDGGGDRAGGILAAGRVRAEAQDRDRPRGRAARRPDQLEVGKIEHPPRRRIRRLDDESHPGPGRQDAAQQQPTLVVEVVGPPVLRVIGERIAAVEPSVARGERQRAKACAVGPERDLAVEAVAVRRVRQGVAQGDGVGRAVQDELDIAADPRQAHGAPARGLGGQASEGPVRANDLTVGGAVLGLVLDEGRRGATASDTFRRYGGHGDRARRLPRHGGAANNQPQNQDQRPGARGWRAAPVSRSRVAPSAAPREIRSCSSPRRCCCSRPGSPGANRPARGRSGTTAHRRSDGGFRPVKRIRPGRPG